MAITKREYILGVCFLSGAAAIVSFVSLGTQYWVVCSALWQDSATLPGYNDIRYGLFSGIFRQQSPRPATYQLEMTCLMGSNVCAFLCGLDGTSRSNQLEGLYNQYNVSFDNDCPQVKTMDYPTRSVHTSRAVTDYDDKFINAGVWITTIFFIVLSATMGIIASALAIYNVVTNPIQYYLSIYGLYIYNGIALLAVIIVLFTWGLMFAVTTIHNVAIFYTITKQIDSSGQAELGFSYWINILSMLLYMISISLLYLRQYLISKEPKKIVDVEDSSSPDLYLY